MYKVIIDGSPPFTCKDCELSDWKGLCKAKFSKYEFWKSEFPTWCPIEYEKENIITNETT